ncbi:MAG TPA: nitroreductase [Dehalococcoidia bacterium]|nr:nitroreductase [Dehalococcoidia bacterium]
MDILEAIAARRSRGKMLPETPPRALVEKVLAAAVEAPNHHDTQPWRFFVLAGEARQEFGEALAQALRRRLDGADPSKLEGLMLAERVKPLRSPVLIVVGVCSDRDDPMTRREDLQAASAALENMLLAANALGLAAIWRTGDGAYDDYVKAHFGLRPEDEIAGVLYLGYADPSVPEPEPRKRDFASKTEWRGW